MIDLISVDIRRFGYNLTLTVFTAEARDRNTTNLSIINEVGKFGFLSGGLLTILATDFVPVHVLAPAGEPAGDHTEYHMRSHVIKYLAYCGSPMYIN